MKGDTPFGCEINPDILNEFIKTFTYDGKRKGDFIKAFIEDAMKKRIENFSKNG